MNEKYFAEINTHKPVINIRHKELKRIGSSIYRSICPLCKVGCLPILIYRDSDSFKLLRDDVCILCGQHFYYTDLEYLGEKIKETNNDKIKRNR